ncbi:glucose-6-phosphate isomerase [Candidatus Uhrbacteria bacterium]|nr:glucose-6-phosphate isomerase [Candidatus Uhrbacteria bacterium]
MPKPIRYDHKNMLREAVGLHGASKNELTREATRLETAKHGLLEDFRKKKQGWLGCPDETKMAEKTIKLAERKSKLFDTCLVLGIGGSDLGARAAHQALAHTAKHGMKLVFAGGNTDPDELETVLAGLDWSKTLINIISKSGETIEPMSAFLVARERLVKTVGRKDAARHIVATTDAKEGSLRKLAEKEGYDVLPIPKNIGGRFSVLTPVGLFPLACAGIDIKKILSGADSVKNDFVKNKATKDPACLFALFHVLGDTERRQNIHVLMPYSSRLQEFGRWFRQIWAESLGKKYNSDGDVVHVGPTPIAALGATDQHSQIQLYMEGPNNKLVTFIEVTRFDSRLKVPHNAKTIGDLKFLAGLEFGRIIRAELKGTADALTANKRPNGRIVVADISPKTIGALFMFFEIATGIAGRLYSINAYDQPGVEEGKVATRSYLTA